MTPNLEIVVGTYEQFVLGYTVDDIVNKYKMEQTFATHSHLATIRSVASSKYYLASSAADDTVCLYDMRNRKECGKLDHHNDVINSIAFTPDASHLMTASSDGTIGIIRCGSWQLEKHWLKPHKGLAVDTLAIHPTGKIAMTTGHDGVLRTWNLVKGRQAYATNLVPRWKMDAKNISVLKWSPNGETYLLAANNKVDIYSVETAGVKKELTFDTKVVCIEYLNDQYIAIGLTDGYISILDIESSSESNKIQAHDARVKCLSSDGDLLVSASSSGEIKLWSFKKDNLTFLNEVKCNARITCLALSKYEKAHCENSEVEIQETIPKVTSNKLRLTQQVVVIEEENDESSKKSKKGKKNARKLMEETDEHAETNVKTKKIKTNALEQSKKKQKKIDEIEEPMGNLKKKKKLSEVQVKRKSPEPEVENEVAESPIKKKKKKQNHMAQGFEVTDNTVKMNKNKRKNPPEDETENSPKKIKSLADVQGNSVSKKKKKKKNLQNKISR